LGGRGEGKVRRKFRRVIVLSEDHFSYPDQCFVEILDEQSYSICKMKDYEPSPDIFFDILKI